MSALFGAGVLIGTITMHPSGADRSTTSSSRKRTAAKIPTGVGKTCLKSTAVSESVEFALEKSEINLRKQFRCTHLLIPKIETISTYSPTN